MNYYKKLFSEIIAQNKKLAVIGLMIMLFMSVLQVLIPLAMKEMIAHIEKQESLSLFLVCILIYALMWLIYNLINVKWYQYIDILGEKVLWYLRERLHNALWRCEYSEFSKMEKEHLKNILFTDVINVYGNIIIYSLNIAADSVMIAVFLGVSFYIDIATTLILLMTIAFGLFFSVLTKPLMAKHSAKVNEALKQDNAINNECIDAVALIRTNGLQEYYLGKVRKSIQEFIAVAIRSDQTSIFLQNLMNHYHQVLVMAITGYLILNVRSGGVGNLVYYIFVTNLIIEKSQMIENNLYRFMKNLASFENVQRLLELGDISDGEREEVKDITEIVFEDVSFSYQPEKPLYKGLSFKLQRGDAVLVEGENGSGKSSLLKIMAGLLTPTSGQITYNGLSYTDVKRELLFREICYLNQEELLLNETPHSYLSVMAHKTVSEPDFKAYRSKVGLEKLEEGIRDNGKQLSGGEKKKMILMKLLARQEEVSVILLDEVEAGLDKQSREIMAEIERNLLQKKEKYIILKISHGESDNNQYYNRKICL